MADTTPRPVRGALIVALIMATVALVPRVSAGQDPPPRIMRSNPAPLPTAPAAIKKIGPTTYQLGEVRVDTAKREVSVTGKLNPVQVLEYVANRPGGLKEYESALTVDTDGITFNAALLLIGLDPSRADSATRHFDPKEVKGDRVEVTVEYGSPAQRVPVERLLFDKATGRTIVEKPWVYTGSTFFQGRYMADSDGVLIGFVHDASVIIENSVGAGLGAYGSIVLNPNLGLPAEAPVRLYIRAIDPPRP